MNRDKYLPIGSIVLLKNAKKRVMITGFVAQAEDTGDKVFDYVGCLYPEGVISSDKNLLFNHEQIDKIYYMGYTSDDEKEFKKKLNEFIEKRKLEKLGNNNIEQQSIESNNEIAQESVVQQPLPDIPTAEIPVESKTEVVDPKFNELLNSLPTQQ